MGHSPWGCKESDTTERLTASDYRGAVRVAASPAIYCEPVRVPLVSRGLAPRRCTVALGVVRDGVFTGPQLLHRSKILIFLVPGQPKT